MLNNYVQQKNTMQLAHLYSKYKHLSHVLLTA